MTSKEVETSIKSFERREAQRVSAALDLIKAGAYEAAICALTDAKLYQGIARQYDYISDLMEVESHD